MKKVLYKTASEYVDTLLKESFNQINHEAFIQELENLSKKYNIVIQVIGGVNYYTNKEMSTYFHGYTKDQESGDIEPIFNNNYDRYDIED